MSKESSSKVRKRSFGTTMGITSIIAILVILVLVVFSTLALITAKADLNLSQKTVDNITAYYEADGQGELILHTVGDMIATGDDVASFAKENGYEYEDLGNGGLLTFELPIDSSRNLNAQVLFDNKGNVKEKQLWQVVPAKEWVEDDSIQLFS